MSDAVTVSEQTGQRYTNQISNGRHQVLADEPASLGGADLGPTPFELLAAALGACTTITLRMYAERKEWPVDHLEVTVTHNKQEVDGKTTDVFTRQLSIIGELTDEQRQRMFVIANKCPVHRTLESSSHIETQFKTD